MAAMRSLVLLVPLVVGLAAWTLTVPAPPEIADGEPIPAERLAGSARCGACHREIAAEWASSGHRRAASDEAYRAVLALRRRDAGAQAASAERHCAGCHEPIAQLAQVNGARVNSAQASSTPESRDEGVACLVCHRLEALRRGTTGNGDLVVRAPRRLADWQIAARTDVHRSDLARPLLSRSEMCAGCHQQFVDEGRGYFRLQGTYDEWKMSRYAAGPDARRCQDCHMPRVADGRGGHRSHAFARGPHGAVAARVDAPAQAEAGGAVRLKVSVENRGVGHKFPVGASGTRDVWLEAQVRDARGRWLLHTGTLDAQGDVEPAAFALGARPMGEDGAWLYRGDVWNLAGFQHGAAVFPGTYDSTFYEFTVPADATGPLSVVARLNRRAYTRRFARFAFGERPDRWPPVTEIARGQAVIQVKEKVRR